MQSLPQASVMNFLNEVANQFPSAIPLAAGRPSDLLVERLDCSGLVSALKAFEMNSKRDDRSRAWLLQYGRTAGIIQELVAHQIRGDDGVPACADRIVITSGCQEALALCLPELCPNPGDVVLVCNPTYIGIAGAAQITGVTVSSLPSSGAELAVMVEEATMQLSLDGRRASALYLIPDFDNPTGRVLGVNERRAVLDVCSRYRIVVLEDNPYRLFRYEGTQLPPVAALDEVGCVIYLSTYSKTLSPALRVGAITLPETLFGDRRPRETLFKALVERKSFNTVNTSQICQAIVGGLILEQQGSLQNWIRPTLEKYRLNRDAMLSQLSTTFAESRETIDWNHPEGGFFLSLNVPFRIDGASVLECANDYGVIVMPMAFFAFDHSQDHRIRLAFSAVDSPQVRDGIMGLGRYIADRCASMG